MCWRAFDGDTRFPEIDPEIWREVSSEEHPAGEKDTTRRGTWSMKGAAARRKPAEQREYSTRQRAKCRFRPANRAVGRAAALKRVLAHPYKGSNIRPPALQAATGGPSRGISCPGIIRAAVAAAHGAAAATVAGRGARVRAARAALRDLPPISKTSSAAARIGCGACCRAAAATSPAFIGLIALAVLAFWVFQAVYTVQPDEVAVELRFGKPKDELSEPGLHFHWWPIETVEIANTAEKLVNIGGGTRDPGNSGPDAVRRPEHRRRAVFRRLPGQRPEGLSVQRCRSR